MWLAIDWVGYFATVLFADLLKNLFFFPAKKNTKQQHPIPFDAVAMKATASIIQKKITQDLRCLQIVLHVQVKSSTFDKHLNVVSNMNTGNGIQLCIFLVGCHPSDSHLAIHFVD